ncbi:MAG: hypothetical protein ACPGU1_06675 [Myxococcota bacterium]
MSTPESPSAIDELAEPERSSIVGGSALVAGLMLASVVVQLIFEPSIPVDDRWIAGTLGSLVAFAAFVSAHRLMSPRGGMWLDHAQRRIGIGLTSPKDVWWVPLKHIEAVACDRRAISSDVADFAWRTYVRLTNGVELVLVETHEAEIAQAVAEELQERTGLAASEDAPAPVTYRSDHTSFRVYRGVAMHGALSVAGFTLTVLGGALYSQVEAAPAFAFFVAPLLLFTGLALVGVVGVKRIATEHLEHKGGLWVHGFGFGPWRWAERTISAPQPVWSLHVRPARGARLELEGEDGTLVIGHGATTRSRASVEALTALPNRFRDA